MRVWRVKAAKIFGAGGSEGRGKNNCIRNVSEGGKMCFGRRRLYNKSGGNIKEICLYGNHLQRILSIVAKIGVY